MNAENIYIVGAGYVGLSTGVALSNKYNVSFIDTDKEKVRKIKSYISPLRENDLMISLKRNKKRISAFSDLSIIKNGSLVFLALPTNYDELLESFDTAILEKVLEKLTKLRPDCRIIIKSTVPIGFTKKIRNTLSNQKIYFSPEFSREGSSYKDVSKPSRIILAPKTKDSKAILNLLRSVSKVKLNRCFTTDLNTAESIKIFANTYLAMRVAYFNELDSFAKSKKINVKTLIDGICSDERIGMFYNNPSFGFGGYCLPKDTKQAKKELRGFSSPLLSAIDASNYKRIIFIARDIKNSYKDKKIGIYLLSMKKGSDNIRSSSSELVMQELLKLGIKIYLYEPSIEKSQYKNNKKIFLVNDFKSFIEKIDVVISNRPDKKILNSNVEIYSRDIFKEN